MPQHPDQQFRPWAAQDHHAGGFPGPPVPPAQFMPYPRPAKARRSVTSKLLIAWCVVLGAALSATLAVGGVAVVDARHRLAALREIRDVQAGQDRAAAAKQQNDLRAADLPGKLQQVKGLDGSVDTLFSQWMSGSVRFGVLGKAIVACENAIDAYDRAVAPFPENLLPGGMPPQVNTANPETDCGRAFTGRL